MNIMNRDLKFIGKGIAILGVWIGWALAIKQLMTPILEIFDSDDGTFWVGIIVLIFLYMFLLILVHSATKAVLNRWDKD